MTDEPVRIIGLAREFPDREFSQEFAIRKLRDWYADRSGREAPMELERAVELFRRAGVEHRYSVRDPESLLDQQGFGETSRQYREHGIPLAESVADRALRKAGLGAGEVDFFITVSCTGFTIPSLDAHLMNRMAFAPDVRRVPIAELGCGGGAAALARASDFLRGHPEKRVLILCLELCTLNFQPEDFSSTQLVASALFGDGAAAVVVAGSDCEESPGKHAPLVNLLDHRSETFPGTLDYMGYDNIDQGFAIKLSPRIPAFVKQNFEPLAGEFLSSHDRSLAELDHAVLHPGGRAILEAMEQPFPGDGMLDASRETLRRGGNLSSATVFHVLDRVQDEHAQPGDLGLFGAFGPGFTAELGLLQWVAE